MQARTWDATRGSAEPKPPPLTFLAARKWWPLAPYTGTRVGAFGNMQAGSRVATALPGGQDLFTQSPRAPGPDATRP